MDRMSIWIAPGFLVIQVPSGRRVDVVFEAASTACVEARPPRRRPRNVRALEPTKTVVPAVHVLGLARLTERAKSDHVGLL